MISAGILKKHSLFTSQVIGHGSQASVGYKADKEFDSHTEASVPTEALSRAVYGGCARSARLAVPKQQKGWNRNSCFSFVVVIEL
jgi:hypothetical protein